MNNQIAVTNAIEKNRLGYINTIIIEYLKKNKCLMCKHSIMKLCVYVFNLFAL